METSLRDTFLKALADLLPVSLARCHGLKVHVPPNPCVETPMTSVMVLGEVISALIKETPGSSLALLPRECTRGLGPGGGSRPSLDHAASRFQASSPQGCEEYSSVPYRPWSVALYYSSLNRLGLLCAARRGPGTNCYLRRLGILLATTVLMLG